MFNDGYDNYCQDVIMANGSAFLTEAPDVFCGCVNYVAVNERAEVRAAKRQEDLEFTAQFKSLLNRLT